MASKNFLTREWYDKLIAELQELKQEKFSWIAKQIKHEGFNILYINLLGVMFLQIAPM